MTREDKTPQKKLSLKVMRWDLFTFIKHKKGECLNSHKYNTSGSG